MTILRAVALAACLLAAHPAAAREVADRIWSGGPILTMNDAAMRAKAIAEKNGRIVAVGSTAEVMKTRGPKTQLIDLGGRALLPGFVDAHGHVVMGGLQALSANLLAAPDGEVQDVASLQRVLKEWMAANAGTVQRVNLVIGFGYDNSQLKELRHPTRDDLDAVSTEVPIFVIHQSGHLGVLNSKALEIAGLTAASEDPAGGVIRRRPGGREPDGVLEETAFFAAATKLVTPLGADGIRAFVRAGAELWARFGYTTAQEGRTEPGIIQVLRSVGDAGELKIDVVAYGDVLVDRDFVKRNASGAYRNRVRVGGGKLTIDGSPQGFTAWRDRPYHAPVGDYPPGYVGYPAATREQVLDAIDWSYANDVQLLTHANGEAATDLLLAAYDAASRRHGPGDRRPVLIHGQFLREDQVDGLRRHGVVPSLFPMHTYYWGDWHRDHTAGPLAADDISPTGWVVARGMRFTSHHDAPVAFPDSMRVLDATVTRRSRSNDIIGPAQRVDVITALKAMTIWSAYQHFEETRKGSLEVGKLADFVVLSADPTSVDPESLDRLQVLETIKEGRTVFALTPAERRRAELTVKPGREGGDAFGRFLAAAAANDDLARLPSFARPAFAAATAVAGPHPDRCVRRYLDGLVAAMLATSRSPAGVRDRPAGDARRPTR